MMFYCQQCDRQLDGDVVESEEWDNGEICIDCHVELTPEDFEDWILDKRHGFPPFAYWTLTHKDYDGAPMHSLEGPADHRCFLGPTIEDVYQQAIEYNEAEDADLP